MRTDQVTVYFADANDTVRADVLGPALHGPLTLRQHDADEVSRRYVDIIDPLMRPALECVVGSGLSDYIVHVLLPGVSYLTISPPQERDDPYEPGLLDGWLVTRNDLHTNEMFEVVDDSEPDGPQAANAESAPVLLAVLSEYLDRFDMPDRQQTKAVRDRAAAMCLYWRCNICSSTVRRSEVRVTSWPCIAEDPDIEGDVAQCREFLAPGASPAPRRGCCRSRCRPGPPRRTPWGRGRPVPLRRVDGRRTPGRRSRSTHLDLRSEPTPQLTWKPEPVAD